MTAISNRDMRREAIAPLRDRGPVKVLERRFGLEESSTETSDDGVALLVGINLGSLLRR